MPAKILMLLSAGILLTLGAMHLTLTFWGTCLTPTDPTLQTSMRTTSPILTTETTMGRY